MLREAKDDLLAFTGFPVSHLNKIWSTNSLERLNKAFRLERPLAPGEYEASLVSTSDARTRYLPEWRFAARGRTLAVGQLGDVREVKAGNRPQ